MKTWNKHWVTSVKYLSSIKVKIKLSNSDSMFFYPSSMSSFTIYFWSGKIFAQNKISVLVVVWFIFKFRLFSRDFLHYKNQNQNRTKGRFQMKLLAGTQTDRSKEATIKDETWKRSVFWKEAEKVHHFCEADVRWTAELYPLTFDFSVSCMFFWMATEAPRQSSIIFFCGNIEVGGFALLRY